ncbi:NAD(P)-dependent alcohol dehydrogenase [Saccharospirillum salsuginis]|uniref:NADPH:quinone reductase n=1 Tax=Saccharospirillum salsuginis TaxID=418750 RepID=A0A918N8L2_9GAMM|nr:NAD(P)-dependent alcohol dehydrogenase [Saccharospirillum salsuginis]GGX47467.1 NADPH:quinone reductase [Saccharospirillum salsuginis]
MKAVVYHQYGPPSVLHSADVAEPRPDKGEIRIRLHACEVTKGDCELRRFRFAVKWFTVPLRLVLGVRKPRRPVLGGYVAGVVDEIGEGVSGFNVGDEVFGSTQLRLGGYGEYVCVPESYTLVPKPENLSFAEAASVPLGGLNALHFMTLADVQPGQRVLINGAGGSIGSYALQIAKLKGAHVTVVDAKHKAAFLQALGADVFLDYRDTPFYQVCEPFDVILNMVAQGRFRHFIDALTPTGRYLMANPRISDMLNALRVKWFSRRRAIFSFAGETIAELRQLSQWLASGQIRPVVDRTFSLDEAVLAHQRVEAEDRLGAVVLVHSSSE